jgi:hypothetical protein
MNRGPSPLLTLEDSASLEVSAPAAVRGGPFRRVLAGFGNSCARVGVALLACLALVAVGTVASLAWTFLVER